MKTASMLWMIFISSSLHSQTAFYKVFTGNIMGAEALAHLHISNGHIGGYLYLVRDPRPFIIYPESSVWKKDSMIIYSSRSYQISVNLSAAGNQQKFQGTAVMYQDDKEIRKGNILLQEVRDPYMALTFFSTAGKAALPASLKNESECTYAASSIWPVKEDNSPVAVNIRKIFYQEFNLPPGKDPSSLLPAAQQKYLADWKNTHVKAGVKETENMGLSLSQDQDDRLMVLSESQTLLTLAAYHYQFTGGAHGNYSTDLICFDKRNGKRLKLADVLTAQGISALPAMLTKAAKSQFNLKNNQSLEQAGFFKITVPVTQNFWVDNAGLGFWYQPYEIGPFAYGEIVLFIPLAQLSTYIQPSFLK